MLVVIFVMAASLLWMAVGLSFARTAPDTWRTVAYYGLLGGPVMLITAGLWFLVHGETR